jgi:hypothetical protein
MKSSTIQNEFPGVLNFTALCPGDDCLAAGVSAVSDIVEIFDLFAAIGLMNQTKKHARPCGVPGTAYGGVGQLTNRVKPGLILTIG